MKTLLCVLLLSISLPFARTAEASIVIEYDFQTLVAQADAIVHARVVAQTSTWVEQTIMTTIDLEIIESLKGPYAIGEQVSVWQHGGVVGDLAMVIAGTPRFFDGEEVVVFLESVEGVRLPLVFGLSQGKFGVTEDEDTGVSIVHRSLSGLGLVPHPRIDRPELIEPPTLAFGPIAVPLDQFLLDIRVEVESLEVE
jgi:hypothetical protein